MAEPTVCAVLLTRDRPDYVRQAVQCFRRQTYERKRLFILDTGNDSAGYFLDYDDIRHEWADLSLQSWPIGKLRNTAIERAGAADIIVHFDDDDWSHPNRIAEQVSLLQASGADCVGYREILFWDCRKYVAAREVHERKPFESSVEGYVNESYLYANPDPTYCLGTSLCYWRRTWERNPFSERNGPNPRVRGEDREFLRGIKSVGVPSIPGSASYVNSSLDYRISSDQQPRMIARIHAGNAAHYPVDELAKNAQNWRRAEEWDERVRAIMEAA